MMLKVIRQLAQLSNLVGVRNDGQNGLVIAAAHQFNLAALGEVSKLLEVFRVVMLQPLQKDSGKMQAQTNQRMGVQRAHKRRIGSLVGVFDDMVEVPHRLVRVDDKSEGDFAQFDGPSWRLRALQERLE